ncbi:HAD-IB family phosphatase [Candidatus Collierbacteria bacterium]|nr:HAD-IB family phosphatase [Candidatus Collierbacteria bacterium]
MKYQNIIFDLDSTLSSIEGIDELGKLRNMGNRIKRLTREAMSGRLPFGDVFIRRLELIRPTLAELLIIGKLYKNNLTPGAGKLIEWLVGQKTNIFVVTAGYTECSYALTDKLKIFRKNVFANKLIFDLNGEFMGVDKSICLWREGGKREIVSKIMDKHKGKTVCVGDGIGDWQAARAADGFIYFGGVAWRPEVAVKANTVIKERNLWKLKDYLE